MLKYLEWIYKYTSMTLMDLSVINLWSSHLNNRAIERVKLAI